MYQNDTVPDPIGHQIPNDFRRNAPQGATDLPPSSPCIYGASIRTQRASPQPPERQPTASAKRRRSWSPSDPEFIESYAKSLRKRLYPILSSFSKVVHFVLTVDPARQSDPSKAYSLLQRQVSEIFRKLKRNGTITDSRYVWILEFHSSGFPHFHVLCDSEKNILPEIQRHFTIGRVFWKRFNSVYEHLGYVTKQLSRRAVEHLPSWFAELPTTKARRFRTSRGFFGKAAKPNRSTTNTTRISRAIRTVSDRQAEFASDRRGDMWISIPRKKGKPIKFNTASIADRADLQRMFGADSITIDRLADLKPTSIDELQVVEALFRTFSRAYQRGLATRRNLEQISLATSIHNRLNAIYVEPTKTAIEEGLLVT